MRLNAPKLGGKSQYMEAYLSTMGNFDKGRKTKREKFLDKMNQVVPWKVPYLPIEPHYQNINLAEDRAPLPIERMLCISCLQPWYSHSYLETEEALYDSISMRRFSCMSMDEEAIPDKTSIPHFRRQVDVPKIDAPSSKSARKQRDPQWHKTGESKRWYFGMKKYIGVDTDPDLLLTGRDTAANFANANVLKESSCGGEDSQHRDSTYHSTQWKARADKRGIAFPLNKRGTKHRPLTNARRRATAACLASEPALEHPFLAVKLSWGHVNVHPLGESAISLHSCTCRLH